MIAERFQQWRQELPEQEFREIYIQIFGSLLKLRYRAVPEWVMQEIAQAETATIDQWLENLIDVDDVENLFTSSCGQNKYKVKTIFI